MTNEVSIDVRTQTIIDALEDTGDYKVFEDSNDGIGEAIEWMQDNDCVVYSDTDEAIEEIIENETASFILDRLKPADVIPYVWDIYINKTVDHLVSERPELIDLCCDTLTQGIIMHKGVDYVLDQCGLDNRVTRACTTDYHYVVDALKDRRSMFIAEDEIGALRYVMHKITASKNNMEKLGQYIDSNCTDELIDAMMGPIYSDKIIRHVESSIDGLVIRKKEEPTDELCEIFLSYLDEFAWREQFIKLMRRHGVMLETIIRAYVDDERAEERAAHDN